MLHDGDQKVNPDNNYSAEFLVTFETPWYTSLKGLRKAGSDRKADHPTTWMSPTVIVQKKSVKHDARHQVIKRERHLMPTIHKADDKADLRND